MCECVCVCVSVCGLWSHLSPGLQRSVQRVNGILAGGGVQRLQRGVAVQRAA